MDLLLLALESPDETTRRHAAHVRACEECRARLQTVRAVLAEVAAASGVAPRASASCLDDAALAEIAESGLSRSTREWCLHLAECAHCREAVASLAEVLADERVIRERSALDRAAIPHRRAPSRRAVLGGAGACAAAVLVALMLRPAAKQPEAPHRGPTISAVEAPAPTTPAGDVADARIFRWTPVPGADQYRITLFDATGRVLYESERNDTILTLPDSITLTQSQPYLWKVEARTGVDRWTSSDLIDFRIGGPRASRSP